MAGSIQGGKVVVNWLGMPELEAMIKELGRDFNKTEQRQAFRYSLTPVRKRMRENIPNNRSGAMWYAIDIGNFQQAGIYRGVAMAVGPRKKRGAWNKRGWHAHFLEGGTKERTFAQPKKVYIPKYNRFVTIGGTGKVRPYRVFTKGIESMLPEVKRRAVDKFGKILEKVMKKHKR